MIRHRYRRIVFFFARILASLALWEIVIPRLGMRGLARRNRSQRIRRIAVQFRALAIAMGGVLIKVGQFLSSRVDVLPPEFTGELAGLQDEVPAERYEAIRQVAEAEFGMALAEKFVEFDPSPLAAASLGQVHRAKLTSPQFVSSENPTGSQSVVVKIQRPGIESIIATDLSALRTVGQWLRRYRPLSRRVDVPALLAEFTRVLYEEIDYLAEGRNAETFAANFRDNAGIHVPGVVWTHTSRKVLTLEDVGAIKITDYEAITAAGIDRREVAKRLMNIYLEQIFEDGFFHADPHPGNLFVTPAITTGPEEERGWQLTFVDFGMVGRVPPRLREGMRELIIAVGTQDAARMVKSYQMLGILLPGADLALIEKAERKAFEKFWGKSMNELTDIGVEEMHEFAREFGELMYSMPFQLPQDIIFLGRAVGILSGMCTGLDPEFNVWTGIAPFAQKLIAEETGTGLKFILDEAGALVKSLLALPRRTEAFLAKAESGELLARDPEMTAQLHRLEVTVRRGVGALVFAVLLLGGIQLYLNGVIEFGIVLISGAGVTLLWVVFRR